MLALQMLLCCVLPVTNGESSQHDLLISCLKLPCTDVRDTSITEFLFANAVLYLLWEERLGFN